MVLKRQWQYLLLVLAAANFSSDCTAHAAEVGISCSTDSDCGESKGLIRGVSVCEDGKCTNPFEEGCLTAMGDKYGKKDIRFVNAFKKTRICNSDDETQERCRDKVGTLAYDEVRIAPSNWESAIFMSWIYQIVLTEMMEVPATMKYQDGKKGAGSFYDRTNGFDIGDSDNPPNFSEALVKADSLEGDCSKTDKPCAHILPDVWKTRVGGDFASQGK